MTLNFLHLKKDNFDPGTLEYNEAVFRENNITKQVEEQGITDYKIWAGMRTPQMPFFGINLGFKIIVQDAKDRGLKEVAIAEDDIYFSHPESWKYFLEHKPQDFDAYFGCVYKSNIDANNRIQFGLSGMTLLVINERFFDDFLLLKKMNNIDREMGRFSYKYKYMVCRPFVCTQHGGYSFHQGKHIENYDDLLEGVKLFGHQ